MFCFAQLDSAHYHGRHIATPRTMQMRSRKFEFHAKLKFPSLLTSLPAQNSICLSTTIKFVKGIISVICFTNLVCHLNAFALDTPNNVTLEDRVTLAAN